MYAMEEKTPRNINFSFPYEPYPIQSDFMNTLYSTLDQNQFGIFESPTGTGKSLSIICGVLTWLRDYEEKTKNELISKIQSLEQNDIETSDDWLSQQSKQIENNQKKQKLQLELKQITSKEERINMLKEKSKIKFEEKEAKIWKELKIQDNPLTDSLDDEDLILDNDINIDDEDASDEENNIEEDEGIKIYFCSRTHSQLTQFINEIRKTSFSDIRLISLASRQNYCINDSVLKLKNITLINERCLDLQKNKKNKKISKEGKVLKKACSSGCLYFQQKNIEKLSNNLILNVQDIEEIVKNGKNLSACPYYASRKGIRDAQIIVVPYNTLLHKSTRNASGLKLKGNIIIIDEAHNLLESLGQMHSCEINGQQLIHAYSQIRQYRDRYQTRFSASNLLSLNQLIFIIGKLIKSLGGNIRNLSEKPKTTSEESKIYTLSDFTQVAEIDNLNIYKLLEFSKKSKLSQKLNGFSDRHQNNVNIEIPQEPNENSIKNFLKEFKKKDSVPTENKMIQNKNNHQEIISNNPILPVLGFLETLTNTCEDGRIILTKHITLGKSKIKFLLLNPASQFVDIVQQARSIIVAGGTMQPFDEFKQQLFLSAGTKESKIVEFSCNHIIPPENILPIVICNGPSGKQFDFSFEHRNSLSMMNELGRLLENITRIVPAGVVCFFPSYDYEEQIFNHLNNSGIIEKINKYKKIFREPKKGGCVEKTLDEYARAIQIKSTLNGAILFSVVGGKLSEGLNFSDDLGRCVILVGLPYANIKSPELIEKMNYLTTNMGKDVSDIYYENLCMKAVNQSIGRAVRHKNDYSTVLLVDHRFSRKKNIDALPKWILRSLKTHNKCGQAFGEICKFFSQKNK